MIGCSPAVSNGMVYFGAGILSGSKVFALSALTGQEVWNYTIGQPWGSVSPRTYLSSVASGYGAVYVIDGGSDPALYAIDHSSGILLWRTPIGETVYAPYTYPCIGEGKVFVGCTINYETDHPQADLLAFDAANGNLIWNKTGAFGGYSTPVLSNGRLYVSSGDTMQSVDSDDGALLWNVSAVEVSGGTFSVPTVSGDKVYATTGVRSMSDVNGHVLVIDALTGQTIMNYITKYATSFPEYGGPAYENGTIYFSHYKTVSALGGSLVGTPTPVTSPSPSTETPSSTPEVPEFPISIAIVTLTLVTVPFILKLKRYKTKTRTKHLL